MTDAVIHQGAAEVIRSIDAAAQIDQMAVEIVRSISAAETNAIIDQIAVEIVRRVIPPPVVNFFIAT